MFRFRSMHLHTLAFTGTAGHEVLRINSINAPYGSLTPSSSVQPLYHDQFKVFFNRYDVKSFSLRVDIVNRSGVPIIFSWGDNDDGIILDTLGDEEQHGKYIILAAVDVPGAQKRIFMRNTMHKLTGRSTIGLDNTAVMDGDPARNHFLFFKAQPVDGVSVAIDVDLVFKLVQNTLMFDRQEQVRS